MAQLQQARPLEGITVLDLSRVLAGPFCTLILAQLGARIIKVEMPAGGDDSRTFGPFVKGKSLHFAAINFDKQSIALNLKAPADRATFEGLAGIADVLVENFRPGTMEKLGNAARQVSESDLRSRIWLRRHRPVLEARRV